MKSISQKWILIFSLFTIIFWSFPSHVHAGVFEWTMGFSYNKRSFSEQDYLWTRRWGTSLGFHFTPYSGVEVAYQDVISKTHFVGIEDTRFKTRVYSFSWVQDILGRNATFQPFFKIGVGQLNQDGEGGYANGSFPPAQQDEIIISGSAGLRIMVTDKIAIRGEATSILTKGRIKTWNDHLSYMVGTSIFF